MFGIVTEEVENINSEEGGFNSGHLWQLKAKLSGKVGSTMTAVLDKNCDLVTSKEKIEETIIEHYSKVLENRPIREGLEKHKLEREELCNKQIEASKKETTPDWTLNDVKIVIKQLKKKKSRDPYGYSNKILQEGGDDLLCAILKLMNNIKNNRNFLKVYNHVI